MRKWKLPASDRYFAPILAQTPEGFELDHLNYAFKHVHQWRTAIDGGAHIGTWTVALAKMFQSVYAFEPALDTYMCLVANTKGLSNVKAMDSALGPANGLCGMQDDPTRPGNTGARVVCTGATATMTTIDAYNLPDVDFIKLDLEGYEAEALKGALDTIRRCGPTIVVECKKFKPIRYGGPEAVLNFMSKIGYRHVGGIRNDQVFVP